MTIPLQQEIDLTVIECCAVQLLVERGNQAKSMMTLGIRNGFGVPTGGSALLSKSRTRVCLPVHCCSRLNLRKSICNERGGLHDSFRGSIITRAAAGRPTAVGQSGKQPSSARGSDSAGVVVDSAGVSPDIEPVSGFGWRKTLWTLVDVIAIVGSVGGALAAMLNLFASSYPVLLLPLCLPALSLLAALQREGLIAEVRCVLDHTARRWTDHGGYIAPSHPPTPTLLHLACHPWTLCMLHRCALICFSFSA